MHIAGFGPILRRFGGFEIARSRYSIQTFWNSLFFSYSH